MTGAEILNDKWDALSERFDLLKTVPRDQARVLNATIAEWQDWFWDKYERWPSDELVSWQDRYVKAARLLDGLAKKTVVVKKVSQTDDYAPPRPVPVKLPPLLVTAPPPKPPPPPYAPTLKDDIGVDVSKWAATDYGPVRAFSRDPGNQGWTPSPVMVKPNRKGLVAVLAAIAGSLLL